MSDGGGEDRVERERVQFRPGGSPDREVGDEVDEELRFHLEARADELVRQGWSPEEAAREARRRFGDVEAVRSRSRSLRVQAARRDRLRRGLEAFRQDLRLAARELVRDPALAGLVVITLALGTGFATALFSLADAVLLRPLPFPEPDRLVYLWQYDRATGTVREPAGTADFYDFRDRARSFAGMGMFRSRSGSLRGDGTEPRSLRVAEAHHDLLGVLGVQPLLGRGFTTEDTEGDAPATILLGEGVWRGLFQGDPAVLGRTVSLDGEPVEVAGVLPAGATLALGSAVDAWVPLRMTPARATRSPHDVTVVARLAPGATLEAASAEMTTLAARMEVEDPENRNRGVRVESVGEYLRGPTARTVMVLQGAVALLLLLMTLNVAHLLLSRSVARSREAAVHRALGAGAVRVAGRAVLATLLLSLAGVVAGLGVATLLLDLLSPLVPPAMRVAAPPVLDLRVVGFGLLLAVLLAVATGLPPALGALRTDLRQVLSGARGEGGQAGVRSRARPVLVAAQGATAAVLLVGAALLGTTLLNLHRVDPGFRAEGMLRLTLSVPATRYPADFSVFPEWPERIGLMAELLRRGGEVPGVEAVALAANHPLDAGFTNSFRIEGRPPDPDRGEMTTRMVTPDYFAVTGLRLLDGRLFRESEGAGDPGTVLINRTAARRHFPEGDALGSRIAFWGPVFREIVGIVEDEHVHGLRATPPPAFYVNLLQIPSAAGELTLLARTSGPSAGLGPPLQRMVAAVDPALGVLEVASMEATVAASLERERFAGTVVGIFAAMAVALAAVGVYGVLSYSVARRRRELGIRLALGAREGQLRLGILRQGVTWVATGVLAGLVVARGAGRVLESLLFGVEPGAVWVYLSSGVLLVAVALLAALLPARRASRVDPALSLRSE